MLSFFITNAIISQKGRPCLFIKKKKKQLKSTARHFNNSGPKGSQGDRTIHKHNNRDSFKYRDHRGRLPAPPCLLSAVISRGRDNSLCSVLCVMWWRVTQTRGPSDVVRRQQDAARIPSGEITARADVIGVQVERRCRTVGPTRTHGARRPHRGKDDSRSRGRASDSDAPDMKADALTNKRYKQA